VLFLSLFWTVHLQPPPVVATNFIASLNFTHGHADNPIDWAELLIFRSAVEGASLIEVQNSSTPLFPLGAKGFDTLLFVSNASYLVSHNTKGLPTDCNIICQSGKTCTGSPCAIVDPIQEIFDALALSQSTFQNCKQNGTKYESALNGHDFAFCLTSNGMPVAVKVDDYVSMIGGWLVTIPPPQIFQAPVDLCHC